MHDRIYGARHSLPPWPDVPKADARGPGNGLLLRTFLLEPPYGAYRPLTPAALRPQPGAILAFEMGNGRASPRELGAWVAWHRARVPSVPLVLRVRRLDAACAHLIHQAGALRVRAVLPDEEPIAETLRRTLANPADLGGDIEEWLRIRFPSIAPSVPLVVGHIVRAPPAAHTLEHLFACPGISERSARHRFARATLPPPGAWLQAMKALRAILALQHDPHHSLSAVALDHGYGDHSALSHQIQRIFGEHAGALRDMLGWEWLIDRWLARSAHASVRP